MNRVLSFIVISLSILSVVSSVNAQTDQKVVCGAVDAWNQAVKKNPSLQLLRQQMDEQINQYLKNLRFERTTDDNDSVRYIPTVFHIIQEGGNENITDAQVKSCVDITTTDYRRQNADTIKTPLAFRPVAADTKIEFRLATIDPQGHCTNGIDRFFSHRTENFNDYGKAIIDWPADKYLNIWVVKSIDFGAAGLPGMIIGYAQFPLGGNDATDGVVLHNQFVGDIGTAGSSNYAGRDGDHEIGHWLNMIHIWGDADCGDDQCEDTPTQFGPNYGCSPPYPHSTCGNDGDMSDNYMDYSDGTCKDIWTQDQKARMRATLDLYRFNIWQPSNLAATGTADPYVWSEATCAPQADFLPIHQNICMGSKINFKDNSINGSATSWSWQFPGGSPATSSVPNPIVTYANAGNYGVTLTVSNSSGSTTITKDNIAIVGNTGGAVGTPYSESFEEQSLPQGWLVYNDDGGPAWQITTRAAYSGSHSVSIQNYEVYPNTAPNSVKELWTPSFDLTTLTKPLFTFRLSYGQQSASSNDSLILEASTDCGNTFAQADSAKKNNLCHFGAQLMSTASGGLQPNNYAPSSSSQWGLFEVPVAAYAKYSNVIFRFRFISGTISNSIYIDDINIFNGAVGINEPFNPGFSFDVNPNPAAESFNLNYMLNSEENVIINLYDLQGRLVKQLENKHTSPGTYTTSIDAHSFDLSSGIYMLRMMTNDGVISKKLIYSNN